MDRSGCSTASSLSGVYRNIMQVCIYFKFYLTYLILRRFSLKLKKIKSQWHVLTTEDKPLNITRFFTLFIYFD